MRTWILVCVVLLQTTPALGADSYARTKYPLVLVHGLLGSPTLFGVDYFYGIVDALESGGAEVHVAQVAAANSTELRGEQLIEQLETIKALTGAPRFNLIGHSHGGPTVRYVASVRPDLVASVTTIGAPHTGSPVADAIAEAAPPGSPQRALAAGVVNALGGLIQYLAGGSSGLNVQDSVGALTSLSSDGAAAFNAVHSEGQPASPCGHGPALVNGVRYYSMGGTSVATLLFDPSDALMLAGSFFFGSEKNDGLVGRCASHWGVVLRDDYGWNHLDEANQVLGLRGLFSASPPSVYRAHANRLKNLGL